MYLDIRNNKLLRCTLKEGEHTVVLPRLDCIEDDAFADIPKGQIRHLDLSCGVKYLAPHAFRGIDRLDSLTVHSFDFDKRENYQTDSLLAPDILCVVRCMEGDFFNLSSMIADGYPRRLITSSDVDIRPHGRELYEGDGVGFDGVEELELCVKGEFSWDHNLFQNTRLKYGLKKLRLINCLFNDAEDEYILYELMPRVKKHRVEPEWVQSPCSFKGEWNCGLEFLECLEEAVLPEGLTDVPEGLLSSCPKLRKVKLGRRAYDNMRPGAFSHCSRLRNIAIYGEDSVSAKDIPGDIAVNQAMRLAWDQWPDEVDRLGAEGCGKLNILESISHEHSGTPAADIIKSILMML